MKSVFKAVWLSLVFATGGPSLVVAQTPAAPASVTPSSSAPAQADVTYYTYRVVKVYPHDPDAFTQGLFVLNGRLFESTGMAGASSLREVDLATGKVKRKRDIERPYFAEGVAPWRNTIIGLTWTHGKAFVWDRESFALKGEHVYTGEGWGLTGDGKQLILSDGTDRLRFLDPQTFAVSREASVTLRGKPINMLNELEYIGGQVYANVWQTDYIVRIDPQDGQINGVIDLRGLMSHGPDIRQRIDVLNGIAYDPATKRLLVTGKYWPALFEIELIDKATGAPYVFR